MAIVSTRREAARARVDLDEEETSSSSDASDEDDAAPLPDKQLRLRAVELLAVAKGPGIEAVTSGTVLENTQALHTSTRSPPSERRRQRSVKPTRRARREVLGGLDERVHPCAHR